MEPYLLATAEQHADCAEVLRDVVETTVANKRVLVHGDVSPKNILVGPHGPVLLDAECAWFGDPAFDLSFCLNHLLLKCVWRPHWSERYLACFDSLADTYLAGVSWESAAAVEARAVRLLPGLLLGRIDGRSPVEYITAEADRRRVRTLAKRLLLRPGRESGRLAEYLVAGNGAGERMSETRISAVTGRRVWDSRGRPTVEAEVRLTGGAIGRAIAPAGASRGSHEAVDLRDGGVLLGGLGVEQAVLNLRDAVGQQLLGLDASDQAGVDAALIALDGTPNKRRLGANALIAVSMAVLHAAAQAAGLPLWRYVSGGKPVRLPLPEIQIFGGGGARRPPGRYSRLHGDAGRGEQL